MEEELWTKKEKRPLAWLSWPRMHGIASGGKMGSATGLELKTAVSLRYGRLASAHTRAKK